MIKALSERTHYSSLKDGIYLNQASLGLIGQPAVTAMQEFLEDVGRHGNVHMSDSDEVNFFSLLRKQAAEILDCQPDCLAIVSSVGEMLSQLPYLFQPPSGSRILAVSSDFPAITRPWIAYTQENECELQFVDDHPDDNLTETLVQNMDERTAVVAVSYVQFSTGTRANISRLREATRRVGARLVVDVTQAAGAIPIHAKEWDADVVVSSGYKWLGGHGGVGLAVMSPEFLAQTPPAPGWMGAPEPFNMQATQLPLAADARRYTQSTMSYVSMMGLTTAIKELLAMGIGTVEAHANSLAVFLADELNGSGWTPFRALDDAAASPHIITLSHPGADVEAVVKALRDESILCGSRNGRIRVSLAHYNDEADVRALAQVLQNAAST